MEQMYKGIPFSPTATLTANISATDTVITVSDVDAFPDAPSIATIGTDTTAETIIYTAKTATALTGCTRGVEGTAKDWQTDEIIGRNFTAKDHADMVKNIEELENSKLDASYKVDVVNTADVSVGGKALDAMQNNPNITGTLAQKVTSNTQQINVLNNNARFKTFLTLEEIGADITTPILDISKLMPDLSKLYVGITANDTSIYPDVQGVLMITRLNRWRAVCEFHSQWHGDMWLGDIIIASDTWNGWYEIPTTIQTQAMIDALNA